jgi:hypothetical protein
MAEMCTAIMVSSLPSLRPLLQKSRRFIISSTPSGSGDKRSSKATYLKANQNHTPPTIGSGGPQFKNDDETDVELVHVGMKGGEKPLFQERDPEAQDNTKTTMGFWRKKPNERPPGEHWV